MNAFNIEYIYSGHVCVCVTHFKGTYECNNFRESTVKMDRRYYILLPLRRYYFLACVHFLRSFRPATETFSL